MSNGGNLTRRKEPKKRVVIFLNAEHRNKLYHTIRTREVDFRPQESIPEDYYAIS